MENKNVFVDAYASMKSALSGTESIVELKEVANAFSAALKRAYETRMIELNSPLAPKAVAPKAVAPKAVAPKAVAPKAVAPTPKKRGRKPKATNVSSTDAKSVRFVKYTEKCWCLVGDSKPFKDKIKAAGGRWKSPHSAALSGETMPPKAWFMTVKGAEKLATQLGMTLPE